MPIVQIDTIGIGPSINRLKVKPFFLSKKKEKKINILVPYFSSLRKICQIFAVFCYGDKKH
jgi:hypothetical protein